MSEFFASGLVMYQLTLAPYAWLSFSKALRKYPLFWAFCIFCVFKMMVVFPLFTLGGMGLYSEIIYPFRMIQFGLLFSVIGEASGNRKLGLAVGGFWSLILALLYFSYQDHAYVSFERLAGFLTFLVAIMVCHCHKGFARFILLGIAIATLFPAISETWDVRMHGGLLRYVPVVSYGVAQAIWIYGALRTKDANEQ